MNDAQLNRLSEIMANFGLLLIASMVIPAFIEVDKPDPFRVLLGMTTGLASFIVSLMMLKGVEKRWR